MSHEPDGNVPPDFLVDGRIAVEVWRLNEHGTGEPPRPLIETEIPFMWDLRALADGLAAKSRETLLIYVEFRRPLPSAKAVRLGAGPYLESLLAAPDPSGMSCSVAPNVTLSCLGERPP